MLKLDKTEYDDHTESFHIVTDDGIFSIVRMNSDIYIKPECYSNANDRDLHRKSEYTFKVTNEDEEIYGAFDDLYNAVKSRKPYSNSIYEFSEKDYILPPYVDINDNNKLFKNNKIEWHSDDLDYDDASVLLIDKKENSYDVTFIKSKETEVLFPTFTVKISLASERYFHFSQTFRDMCQKLDSCYYQQEKKNMQRTLKKSS